MPRRGSFTRDLDFRSTVDYKLQRYHGTYAVRVVRNRKTGQVLYLEAEKDFIDTLLSFLLLPTGTIIHMLSTGVSKVKPYGSMSSMFKSVEKLDSALLHVAKNVILVQPRPAANNPAGLSKATTSTGLLELCLDADATKRQNPPKKKKKLVLPENFFKCDNCDRLSSKQRERCYLCWPENVRVYRSTDAESRFKEGPYYLCPHDVQRQDSFVAAQEPVEEYNCSTGPGFVMGGMTFMVTDSLEIMPTTTTDSMKVLNALNVSSLADIESEKITVTITQVLQLLQSALSSTTCLNNVFKSAKSIESKSTSFVPMDLKDQLREKEIQIELLESQVRSLGMMNEDLTAQLNGGQMKEGAEDTDASSSSKH